MADSLEEVTAGDHKIKLEKAGFKIWERTLTVSVGATATWSSRMKMHLRRISMLRFAGLTLAVCLFAQKKLTPSEAKEHFGETATVCGEVASARYAESSKGQPTFLNLDQPYPNQIFTAVIWGENRSKFGKPEDDYKGRRICVS